MLKRLLERGKTSGREDDNVESIKKRFREQFVSFLMFVPITKHTLSPGTFEETSMPVMDYYRQQGKVVEVGVAVVPFRFGS